jgi:transposase InsO family protein
MYPNERKESATAFLRAAVAQYAGLSVCVERVITDNGPAFHSAAFAQACLDNAIAQKFTRAFPAPDQR